MSDLSDKWRRASEAARKSEHHFPADCLAEAAITVESLVAEVESLRAKLVAVEAAHPGDDYLTAKPHKALDVVQAMLAAVRSQEPPTGEQP